MPEMKSNFSESCLPKGWQEPLVNLIEAYRSAIADYSRNAPDDAEIAAVYAEASYRKPRIALTAWKDPAMTLYGAVHALRLAHEADQNDDSEMVSVMLKAALGYFDPQT